MRKWRDISSQSIQAALRATTALVAAGTHPTTSVTARYPARIELHAILQSRRHPLLATIHSTFRKHQSLSSRPMTTETHTHQTPSPQAPTSPSQHDANLPFTASLTPFQLECISEQIRQVYQEANAIQAFRHSHVSPVSVEKFCQALAGLRKIPAPMPVPIHPDISLSASIAFTAPESQSPGPPLRDPAISTNTKQSVVGALSYDFFEALIENGMAQGYKDKIIGALKDFALQQHLHEWNVSSDSVVSRLESGMQGTRTHERESENELLEGVRALDAKTKAMYAINTDGKLRSDRESKYKLDAEKMFPHARAIRRKVVYHYGPTNSGKTHSAVERLLQAPSGVYAAPLRLLALELFDRMNRAGVYTSLMTGQEKELVPFATHVSCTVEMANVDAFYDVSVIDEIQLIGDTSRGWAWTRCFLGLQSREIHLCGDGSALPLIETLCKLCGDEFEAIEYERRGPLVVSAKSLEGSLSGLRKGDALIVFSRDGCYEMKSLVKETKPNMNCCVIYGKLPPESRAEQARLFNEPGAKQNVLISTDAVGMGLNLKIGRIIFVQLNKTVFNRTKGIPEQVQLTPPQVRQIAGRAGRDPKLFESGGEVTCFFEGDMEMLREKMTSGLDQKQFVAGLMPTADQLRELLEATLNGDLDSSEHQVIRTGRPGFVFHALLIEFKNKVDLGVHFEFSNEKFSEIVKISTLLANLDALSIEDRLAFCSAPLDTKSVRSVNDFVRMANEYCSGRPVSLDMSLVLNDGLHAPSLFTTESRVLMVDTYLFLSLKFGRTCFPDCDLANALRGKLVHRVNEFLTKEHLLKHLLSPKGIFNKKQSQPGSGTLSEAVSKQMKQSSGAFSLHHHGFENLKLVGRRRKAQAKQAKGRFAQSKTASS